jgi:uncharacterized protein YjbI with pentapeptide repeats
MANTEHLKILKQGVEAWNKWRKENPDVIPDLSEMDLCSKGFKTPGYCGAWLSDIDLHNANLQGVKLNKTYLGKANLRGANLNRARFEGTVLMMADLSRASLVGAMLKNVRLGSTQFEAANLEGADLTGLDLSGSFLCRVNLAHANMSNACLTAALLEGANLVGVNLRGADLRSARLSKADLREVDMSDLDIWKAHFIEADLSGVNLTHARLQESWLIRANLKDADLRWAIMTHANLRNANLFHSKLEGADLRGSSLVKANLKNTTLTGVKLYGSSRDDWIIKDVQCSYIYWDYEGKHRSPKDRDLEPEEFEQLYASLPTIEYIFENEMTPIDLLIMDRVVQALREKRPEFDIKIDSINARGLAPFIRFTIQQEKHKEPALIEVGKEYEIRIKQLELERDRYWEIIKCAFDKPREVKLITAGPGAIVATDGSTINIQQHIQNALDLQKVIAAEPEESEGFAKVAKKMALDIIGDAIKDVAKGQVKEAAKQIIELGKDLGPLFVRMAPVAYEFFKNIGA